MTNRLQRVMPAIIKRASRWSGEGKKSDSQHPMKNYYVYIRPLLDSRLKNSEMTVTHHTSFPESGKPGEACNRKIKGQELAPTFIL